MTIQEVLEIVENTLEEDLQGMSKKERCTFWAGLKEFETPKLQRTGYRPNIEEDDLHKIYISIHKNDKK